MNRISVRLILFFISLSGIAIEAQTYGDYTFYSGQNSTKAYLVNMSGATYHSWTFASNKPTGYSSYLLEGGVVLRTVSHPGNYFNGGGMTGEVQKVDWNGNVLWDYVCSTTTYCAHHDVCEMPNGNVLIIAYESKTAAEVSQAGCSLSIVMWPDKIIEVQPSGTSGGNIVWEWHVWDHLCQNYNSAKSNYVTSIVQHPELLNINYSPQKDWMHCNGIDYNAALDQITFSSHMLNEIYVIDHSTTTAEAAGHTGGNSGKGGDFLYRWGNPAAYQASGNTIFNVVHDAHWVPEGCPRANYLAAFNNKGGTGGKTCVDLFNPPYSGNTYTITPGSAFTPPTYNWRHTYSGAATQDLGNSQQLPNGNTLVCIAQSGYVYEIDSNQTVVWSKSIGGVVPHAYRYTACYVNGAASVTAGASQNEVCPGTSIQLTATPSSGTSYSFAWTSIPAGFTSTLQNPVVTPVVSTSYIVTMTSGTCSSSDTTIVGMLPPPTVVASAVPQEVCPNGSSQLTATPGSAGNFTYNWSSVPAGFSSSIPNPLVGPSVSTMYIVNIAADGCTAGDSVVITVYDLPATPTIAWSGDSLMSSSPTGNQWFFNGDPITGETGQYLVPVSPGSYTVQTTNVYGCVSAVSLPFLYVGVGEKPGKNAWIVYPNPTSGVLHIKPSLQGSSVFGIRVFNSIGKMVCSGGNTTTVDMTGFDGGVYYISFVTCDSVFLTKKVILIK